LGQWLAENTYYAGVILLSMKLFTALLILCVAIFAAYAIRHSIALDAMNETYIEAVHFWSKYLRDAIENSDATAGDALLRVLHHTNRRDSEVTKKVATIHAKATAKLARTLTLDGIERFERSLTEQIIAHFERWPRYFLRISMDYDPCDILRNALQAGGMTEAGWDFFFPWKTYILINIDGSFSVNT